jgi:KDO2-lipid IV(A) lauroyltransferase
MAKRAKKIGPLQTAVHLGQYAGARALSWVFGAFPTEQNLRTAGVVADAWARMNPRRLERAVGNIRRAMPDLPDERVHELALGSVRYMFRQFMVDAFQLPRLLTDETWPRHVDMSKAAGATATFLSGKPGIFIAPHAGNWELLGQIPATLGFRIHALARPLDNPFLWNWALGLREARGMRVVTKFGATDEVTKIIEEGGRIAFIADQNAGEDGVFVPFFGQMASAYKSIGLLAMRYELPIVISTAFRVGDGFDYQIHTVDVIQPGDWRDFDDPLFYVTARYNRAMERAVLLAPDQYLWMHRRWKSRPKWEREGKPIPDRVKAKLRALPWMDDAQMARLEEDAARNGREIAAGRRP